MFDSYSCVKKLKLYLSDIHSDAYIFMLAKFEAFLCKVVPLKSVTVKYALFLVYGTPSDRKRVSVILY
jgi:hypothetical protein